MNFTPAALPAVRPPFTRPDPGAHEHDQGEACLNAHHAVHLVADTLEPGLIGIQWNWP